MTYDLNNKYSRFFFFFFCSHGLKGHVSQDYMDYRLKQNDELYFSGEKIQTASFHNIALILYESYIFNCFFSIT